MQVTHALRGGPSSYWKLREGAQQCLKAAHLQGQHLSLLQGWLGPIAVLVEHATKHDMELVMKLRQFFPDRLQVNVCPMSDPS